MMLRLTLAILVLAALPACVRGRRGPIPAPAGFAPPIAGDAASRGREQTQVDAESGISETTFPNGLRLLVVPQPENPMVACTIWYTVGSRDEGVGETGLSHYLEHMQFKGTKKYPKGMIDKLTQQNGGANNATTYYDRTNYYFSFPADRWRVALEIEAERMRNSDVQQAEFDAEKNVVLQELERNLDDPEDVLYEAVGSHAFPAGPYHHPVIGWPQDVRTTTRERMMRYYEKHYTPDRATIVIVGGVDRDAVVAAVREAFAAIPRGAVERREFTEPPPAGETRLTLRQNTQVPRLLMAFRSRSIRDPKEPWLDILSEVLAGDKTTRLEKRLVDRGIAAAVACRSDARRDDGIFLVQVEPTEGHTLDECEAAVNEVLAELAASGPTAGEIAQARAKLLAARVFGAESSLGLANRLGELAVTTDWRYHLRYPKVIEGATTEGLRDLARAVFVPGMAVVGRSLPREAGAAAAGGSGATGGPRVARRSDRDAPAPGGANGGGSAIERALELRPSREVLPNGLTVLVLRRAAAPVFYARLAVRDGRLGEAVPGLDALTGALLEEGTTARSAEEVAAAIGGVGGTLSAGGTGVAAKTLTKDAGLALDLAFEVATKPAFAPDALERARARQLQAIEEEMDTPARVGAARFAEAVYGKDHPLGRSGNGTRESVRAITREQVVAHHARFFVPKNATLTVVSDRAPEEVLPLVRAAFGAWTGGEKPVLALPAIPAPRASATRLSTDKVQANTYLGHVGIARTDPDYVALEVMDNVFGTGAGFTDRLSRNIRDDKGLAYTVYGHITRSAGVLPGTFRVYAGTKPTDVARTLVEMRAEVRGILERPPTAEELAGAKAALRGGLVSRLETAADVAEMLDLCERYALGFDYPRRYMAEVERVTAEDVIRVARAHVHPDALIEVVVGPESAGPEGGAGK